MTKTISKPEQKEIRTEVTWLQYEPEQLRGWIEFLIDQMMEADKAQLELTMLLGAANTIYVTNGKRICL